MNNATNTTATATTNIAILKENMLQSGFHRFLRSSYHSPALSNGKKC